LSDQTGMRINEAKPESQKRIEQTIAHFAHFPERMLQSLVTESRLVKSRLGDFLRYLQEEAAERRGCA
jgi:hypothetical protein